MSASYSSSSIVKWRSDLQSVWIEWAGYVDGNEFRDTLFEGLKLLVLSRSSRWIEDQSVMRALAVSDVQWHRNVWLPEAIKKGLKFQAIVIPKSSYSKMSARQEDLLSRNIDGKLLIQYFDNIRSAEEWIKNSH